MSAVVKTQWFGAQVIETARKAALGPSLNAAEKIGSFAKRSIHFKPDVEAPWATRIKSRKEYQPNIKRGEFGENRRIVYKRRAGKRVKFIRHVSAPGTPPHTHNSKSGLAASIQWAPTQDGAVTGPNRQRVGISPTHEFGRARYQPRPFMRPAMEATKNEIPRLYANMLRKVKGKRK